MRIALLLCLIASRSFSAWLEWDRVPEDMMTNVEPQLTITYRAHIGRSSRSYDRIDDVGSSTSSHLIEYFEPGTRMFLAATAFRIEDSIESEFSEEVTYDPPTLIHIETSIDLTNWVEITNVVFVATNGSAYVRARITAVVAPLPPAPPQPFIAMPKSGALTTRSAPIKSVAVSISPPKPSKKAPGKNLRPKTTKGAPH